jgi:hypothetical protein
MQTICKECNWYLNGYCKLNPQTVRKDPEDTCSHFLPKMIKEDFTPQGTGISPI